MALADARASDTILIESAVAASLGRRTPYQFVAKSATNAGTASHRSPFTKKNIRPQKPKRLIQLLISTKLLQAALMKISALSVSRVTGGSKDRRKI